MRDEMSGWFGLLVLAGIVWWWTGPSSDETVVYSAKCTNEIQILPLSLVGEASPTSQFKQRYEKDQADRANCIILSWGRTFYKINEYRAEVYYDSYGAQRLTNCAILSRTDWACSFPDGSGKVEIIDGLEAIHADRADSGFFYLRRWQWWYVKLYWWIDTEPRGAWLIPEQHRAGALSDV